MVEQRALARSISDRTTDCLCSKGWSDRKFKYRLPLEKSLTKFTLGETNHVRTKVIGVIKNHRPPKPTLSSKETKALKELRNDKNLVISKADKGNTTVVMDEPDYDKRLLTMLEDNTTYQQLQKDPTPHTENKRVRLPVGCRQ